MPSYTTLSPDNQSWRAFAAEHATSPLQRPGWLDVLTGAYGLRARIAALTDTEGSLLAILPMIRRKLPWRASWTSLPFTDTFEPVAVDSGRREELLVEMARHAGAEPVLVHTQIDLPGWSSRPVGTMQVIDVSGGAAGVLAQAESHHRRSVERSRRAEAGLSARPIVSRDEFLGANLALTASSRRRLGVPTQPSRYWSRVWELHERDEAMTIGVYLGDALVANGVFVIAGTHAVYKYGASEEANRHLRTNFLMFATAFDLLAARGVRSLDFGLSALENTGLRKFKSRWGGEELTVCFSATDPRMLPDKLEPGPLLTKTIQRTPVCVGRTVGSVAYPFVA